MKNASLFPDRFRLPWLLLLVASATAMSLYLLDPYSVSLPRSVCCLLVLAAWVTVARAWDRCLRLNRRVRPSVLLLLATLVLLVVSTLQTCVFRCAPPTAIQQYTALADAVESKDLAAAQAILAYDRNPDYMPPPNAGCYAMEECSDRGRVLDTAVIADDLPMVTLLLRHGARVNDADGNSSALWQAVHKRWQEDNSRHDVIDALLKCGANPNSVELERCQKWSALQIARRQDDIPLAKMLKKAGAREHAAFPQEPNCVWARE